MCYCKRTLNRHNNRQIGQHITSTRLSYTGCKFPLSLFSVWMIDLMKMAPCRILVRAVREDTGVLPVNRMAGRPHIFNQGKGIKSAKSAVPITFLCLDSCWHLYFCCDGLYSVVEERHSA